MATLTNLNKIRKALIHVTEKLIGSELSTIQVNGVQVPSVLRDITGGNIPDYPFVVISEDSSAGIQGRKLLGQYIDENNKLQILTEQYVYFNVRGYGKDVQSILNDLVVKLNFSYDRYLMEQEAEASFMEFSGITYSPLYLSERFIESSEMTARLSIRTHYSPTEDFDMVGLNVSGDIATDNKGNDIPLDININTNE